MPETVTEPREDSFPSTGEPILKSNLELFYYDIGSDFFRAFKKDFPSNLPQGYAYKGGVARAALFYIYGYKIPIRDIDLVAISDLNPDENLAIDLAKRYMPRDFSNGDGVEIIGDIGNYFVTRDFTINEALLVGSRLYFSPGAMEAMKDRTIKGSEFELDYFNGRLGPKLALKAMLLKAVLEVNTEEEWTIEDVKDTYPSDFYIALALNKALSLGKMVTNKFIRILRTHRYINHRVTVKVLVEELSSAFNFDIDDWPDYRHVFDIDTTTSDYLEDEALVRYFGARASHLV